ncbi:MAG TPA: ABC transporter substrate-binding protein [Bacteroidia bacterium]|nr:ABC transporter substrate-binding protein [Bacteroidia bacterium]
MSTRIGLLLPRSTDYPALSFDLLDSVKLALSQQGFSDVQCFTENTGFGEDASDIYSKAEKLIIEKDVHLLIVYSSPVSTEGLGNLAAVTGKPFLLLDAGMQYIKSPLNPNCLYITLQGLHACRLVGRMAGENKKQVVNATSFFDAGYRGPFDVAKGIEEAGGAIIGNYISGHRIDDFSIAGYMEQLKASNANAVVACFSTYLAGLFFDALKADAPASVAQPFYCAPFMAEENLLGKHDFPGGEFHTVTPWTKSLDSPAQQAFAEILKKEKNKTPNIFLLLGWEAGLTAAHILQSGKTADEAVAGWTIESPRGPVKFHPKTNSAYAPLYRGSIMSGEDGKCKLMISETIPVTAEEHLHLFNDGPEGPVTNWKNTYFCS